MALARASQQFLRRLSTASMHSSTINRAPAAAAACPDPALESALQGLLGLTGAEVRSVLATQPEVAASRPSVLQERVQFLACALGISSARLRSLVLEKPALLSDLSVRELRSMAGL
jgi:hypothetical protein